MEIYNGWNSNDYTRFGVKIDKNLYSELVSSNLTPGNSNKTYLARKKALSEYLVEEFI